MQVTMLLADAAEAVDNKLYVLGGGWSITGPDPTPSAIGILIKVPWDQTNRRHELRLELVDQDGSPVHLETPVGPQPLVVAQPFEVGRPAGMRAGTPVDLALALSVGPLPLEPGQRYQWQLFIDGASREDWRASFEVRRRG